MNQSLRGFLWTTLLVAVAGSAHAQGWAVPSKTPETPVSCAGCPGQDASAMTVGYKAPIATFTGRFLDSSNTSEWFLPYRTARAKMVLVVPALDRIYFRYGDGSIAAYGLTRFFSRLEAGEQLVFGFGSKPADRGAIPEVFLKWDEWFNPEVGGSKWKTFNIDGATRMTWFDVDDKGYVYVASTIFGWGIVKDSMGTSGLMMSNVIQKFPNTTDDAKPGRIAVVKGASKYYAIVGSPKQPLWDVTDRTAPKLIATTAVTGIGYYARNAAGDRIAMVDAATKLVIYTGDGLANGSGPLFSSDVGYINVTGDGTNFYGLKSTASGFAIAVIVPSGANGYTVQGTYPLAETWAEVNNIHYGDGYIVLTGSLQGSWDLRVLKVGPNLIPTPVTINATPANSSYPSYFRNYYAAAPPGYVAPGYVNMLDGTVYRSQSGKTYLIVCAKGIGDVYEIQAGDSITTTNDGPVGTVNPNTPAASNSKTFYGDPVKFTAKSSSANISTVVWNFGNPEAGSAKNAQQTSPINNSIPYQYSNLAKTGVGTKNVSASTLDGTIKGTTTANVEMPTARFAIAGSAKFLFTQPNASSAAPIVLGDSFVDASDGTVESHFASWALDGTTTKGVPTEPMSVGQCGTHSLVFTTSYGPYTGSGAGLATTGGSNFVVGLDASNGAVNYAVRPFAAAVELASSNATTITFRSTSRVTTNALWTAAHTAGLSYKWELVTSAGVLSFAGPAAVGTIAIPDFQVPKTNLVSAGMRVRLTLSTTAPFTGACAGLQDSAAVSAPLSPPDPRVIQSGDCQGTPCTFTASSLSGIDTVADNWTYQWQVVKSNNNEADNNAFTAASTTGSTFTPTFIKTGSFNVRLTVTNATGSKLLDTPVTINTAAAPCPHMTDSSYVLGFTGKSTGCNKFSSCTSGETVTFSADFPLQGGYDPTCAVHSYTWSIPGSASQTTNTPTVDAVVTSSGTVTLLVNNGNESHSYSTSLTVGSGNPGCTVNCGNTNPCGTMGTSNIFITFSGNQGCVTGGTCKNNENLTFNVSPSGYSFSCASHAFNWNFGDGATASAQTPSHAFTTSGSHTVSLQIINAWQTFNKTIPVTTSDSTGGGTCQAMNTNSIAIAYSAVSGCSSNNATACKNGESVQFDVTSFTGYDFSCSNHTFSWNFGDGGTANIKSPTHTFSASGAHNVSVTITNPQTPSGFTRQLTMQTTAGGTGTCGTIVPNISIFIDYNNPTSTCGPLGGSCGTGEVISFTVRDYGAYDSSCAAHTYDWNFGDNSAHGSGKDVTHQYAAGGTFTVTCIVNNTSQTVTLTQAISIGGNPGGPDVKVDPVSTPVVGEAHAFMFSVTVTGAPASAVYVWDLGDGTTKTRTNSDPFKYTYEKSGKYTVTVKVYSNSSQTQLLKTQTFTVNDGTAKRRSVRH